MASSDGKSNSALKRLREYGAAGVLAYGCLNGLYYSLAFTVAWLSMGGAGAGAAGAGTSVIGAAFRRSVKVMGLVWAGSQVTKVFRYAGALALAPAADRLLSGAQRGLRLRTRGASLAVLSLLLLASTVAIVAVVVVSSALATAAASSAAAA
ncbi:unnamed protein product, partial [Phaeothamnion confervicola]